MRGPGYPAVRGGWPASSGVLLPPGAPTISGAPSIGATMTIVAGAGPAPTSYHLLRDGVDVGVVVSGYTYLAADVGPSLTVVPYNGVLAGSASNALQYALYATGLLVDYNPTLGTPTGYTLTSGRVSSLLDQSGAARHLTQASATARPVIATAGAPDGVHDAIDFALNGAVVTYVSRADIGVTGACTLMGVQQVPNTDTYLCDGDGASRRILNNTSTLQMNAGSSGPTSGAVVAGTWFVGAFVFNGASSKMSINGAADISGDAGATVDPGLTYGANDFAVLGCERRATRLRIYNGALSAAIRANISAYLKWWAGL